MARSYVLPIPLTTVDSATFINNNFFVINAAGLTHPCFLLRIINNSNITILISYDGVNNHDILPPNDTLQLDFQTNSQPSGHMALLRKGTVIYAKRSAGAAGVGIIYLCGYYQEI